MTWTDGMIAYDPATKTWLSGGEWWDEMTPEEHAIALARTTEMNRAEIAREIGEPYTRVYKWLRHTPLHRDEVAAERKRQQEEKIEQDRQRLAELLVRYRAGELVQGPPWWTLAEVGNAILDEMHNTAERIRRMERSEPGEPLTEDEIRVLGLLDTFVLGLKPAKVAFDEGRER